MESEVELLKTAAEARAASPLVSRNVVPKDFIGFLRASVAVPEGSVGLVLDSGGERKLEPGRHRVRNVFSIRLPHIAFVSQVALTLSAHVAGLLSGGAGGELLDGDLHYGVSVADPARFIQKVGNQPDLRALDLARLLEPRLRSALAPLTRQYAVGDLVGRGPAAEKVLTQFRESLASALAEFGLLLKWVHTPTLYRAEDAVLQAQRAMEMRRKLREIELDEKMDELQKKAELEDFRTQLAADDSLQPIGREDADVGKALEERVSTLVNHVVGSLERRFDSPGYFARLVESGSGASTIAPADLQRTDNLLRQQVIAELKRMNDLAREARSRIFAGGDTELALRLKALERQIESAESDLSRIQPVYLSSPALSFGELQRALTNDDAVLAAAQKLADTANEGLGAALAGRGSASQWADVENGLAALRHQFAGRARIETKSQSSIPGL